MAPRQGGRRALWGGLRKLRGNVPATAEKHYEGNCAIACIALCRAYGACKQPVGSRADVTHVSDEARPFPYLGAQACGPVHRRADS